MTDFENDISLQIDDQLGSITRDLQTAEATVAALKERQARLEHAKAGLRGEPMLLASTLSKQPRAYKRNPFSKDVVVKAQLLRRLKERHANQSDLRKAEQALEQARSALTADKLRLKAV